MDSAKELKSIITGLLISSTQKSTIKQLSNDFLNTVGYPIPFRRLGFKTAEDYLRSIPDTVNVNGYGFQAEITPVIQQKSAHINEMVARQKKNPNASSARRRSFRPPSRPSTSQTSYYNNTPKPATVVKQEEVSQPIVPRTFQSEFTSKIPRDIQNNLRKLIAQFPQGVSCGKIPLEYRKLFRRDLTYENFNCRSVIEIIAELPEIFHYLKLSDGDYWVCEINIPLPNYGGKSEEQPSEDNDSKEITDMDWSQVFKKIPDNVMALSDFIPPYFPIDQKQGDYLQISIGEMFDPGKFWVYLSSPGPLGDLMKEMQKFFKEKNNSYLVPQGLVTEGLYCAVLHKGKYHRGITVKTLPKFSDQVMVLFIDYGTVGNINFDKIHFLPKKFGTTPSQAFKARLSNVYPLVTVGEWTLDCIKKFRQFITHKTLIAELMLIDEQSKVVEIYLADISDEDNMFYINDALVKEGHALYYDDVNEQIDKLNLDHEGDKNSGQSCLDVDDDDW